VSSRYAVRYIASVKNVDDYIVPEIFGVVDLSTGKVIDSYSRAEDAVEDCNRRNRLLEGTNK
jgi:hypothetical protein